jgi:hypothetical protein
MDEYTLAAFLAGTLPEDRRREVLAFLSENADARELLCMAHEALEAAQQPVVEPFKMPPPALSPRSAERPAASPADTRSPQPRWRTRGFAAASLGLVVTTILSLSVYVALQDVDRTRSSAEDTKTLKIHVLTQPLEFRWDKTPDAYQYHLVIWDVEAVEIVEQHDTQSTRLAPEDPFMQSLVPRLKAGRTYSVSVNAVNLENRTFAYSKRQEFRWQE